jgi:transcriptional regulator with XRE-family HTH domain
MPHKAHKVDIHVGEKIRERRLVQGLTQVQVATELGISFQQMQKYETGYNRVSSSKLFEIANFLDCPISLFFEGLNGAEPLLFETMAFTTRLNKDGEPEPVPLGEGKRCATYERAIQQHWETCLEVRRNERSV